MPSATRCGAKKKIDEAIHEASRAEDANDLSFNVRQSLRAHSVLTFVRDIQGLPIFEELYAITRPLQILLNKVAKAEEDVRKYAHALDSEERDCIVKMKQEATKENFSIFSGNAGKECRARLGRLLKQTDEKSWLISLSGAELFRIRKRVFGLLADAWRRLEFRFAQPKYVLLGDLVSISAGSDERARECLQRLESSNNCPKCWDELTSMLHRLGTQEPGRLHRAGTEVAPLLPFSSAPVEKHHLLGQALRNPKSRGNAPAPEATVSMTFRSGAIVSGRRRAAAVESSVLRRFPGMSRARLAQRTRGFAIGSRGARQRRTNAGKVSLKPKQLRKSSAWQMFRRGRLQGAGAFGSKIEQTMQRSIAKAWRDLPAERKLVYDAAVKKETH